MDLVNQGLDQVEKRADIADERMERILTAMQVTLTGLATKNELSDMHDSIRNWGIAVVPSSLAAHYPPPPSCSRLAATSLPHSKSG
jgi:hypothetical protein